MNVLWPDMLWLLLALPALAGAYVVLLRRRRRALRYASLSLVRDAAGPGPGWRRHLPPLLLLAALAIAIVATARPSTVLTLPDEQRVILLAIDVSLSMSATDIAPTRLAAAQAAARRFVAEQPADVRIGIVSFAGTASLVQPPTRVREDLDAAIDHLELDRHTAIGSGILLALATLFPEDSAELQNAILNADDDPTLLLHPKTVPAPTPAHPPAVEPGSFPSAAIILLTDGRRTIGPDPVEAARMAAERGVRIFTVGFGTTEGAVLSGDGWSIYMRFDEEALRAIADITRARYFYAGSAEELGRVYGELNTRFVLERRSTEITALFAAAAAGLALVAAALSVWWFNRAG